MDIGTLTTTVNTISEESFTSDQVTMFANDALARINIESQANFPFYATSDPADYTAFPEKWQRALVIPFVMGRIKQVDSSQFEYTDSFKEFMSNLVLFKAKFPIPDAYKDTNESTSFEPDYTGNNYNWQGAPIVAGPLGVPVDPTIPTPPPTGPTVIDGGTF